MPLDTFHTPLRWLAGSLLGLTLAACNTAPTALDQRFGDAVKKAQTQQTLNSTPTPCMHRMGEAACPMGKMGSMSDMKGPMSDSMHERMRQHHQSPLPDTDGVAAQAAVTRYQDSVKSPPPPAPVFNIGLGSASAR